MCHHVDKVELLEECLDLCVEEQGLLEATWENPDGKTEGVEKTSAHTIVHHAVAGDVEVVIATGFGAVERYAEYFKKGGL